MIIRRAIMAIVTLTFVIGCGAADNGRTVDSDNDHLRRIISDERWPCAEDEVMTRHPSFGSDHVGCIHVERITD